MAPREERKKRKERKEIARAAGLSLVEIAHGAAWLVGLGAAIEILNRLLGRGALGALVAGAALVDFGATRAGVTWSVEALPPGWKEPIRRLGVGFGVGLVAALVVALLGKLLGAGAGGKPPALGIDLHLSVTLLLTVARAAAIAVRDELLYRGIALHAAARAGAPPLAARLFAAAAGAAAIALAPGTGAGDIALAFASGWLFATLWQREKGAWMAVGAHVAWALLRPRLPL